MSMKRFLILISTLFPALAFSQSISWRSVNTSQFSGNSSTFLGILGNGVTNVPIRGLQGSGGSGTAATNGTLGMVLISAANGGVFWGAASGLGDLLAANNLSDVANTGAARTNLAAHNASNLTIGTVANARLDSDLQIFAAITPSTDVQSLLGAANYAAMRTLLGLVIGTDVLAPNGSGANLTALNASQLTSGTAPPARLATNAAAAGLVLQATSATTAKWDAASFFNYWGTNATAANSIETPYHSTFNGGMLINGPLTANSFAIATNLYGNTTTVNFLYSRSTTNLAGNLAFDLGILNLNPTNYNELVMYCYGAGANRTVTAPASWSTTRADHVVTNAQWSKLTITAQFGAFTNLAQEDYPN